MGENPLAGVEDCGGRRTSLTNLDRHYPVPWAEGTPSTQGGIWECTLEEGAILDEVGNQSGGGRVSAERGRHVCGGVDEVGRLVERLSRGEDLSQM